MSPAIQETIFHGPDPSQQRAIQTWAHSFGFDYEYSIATRAARVVKAVDDDAAANLEHGELEFFEFDSFQDAAGVPENDLSIRNVDIESLNMSLEDMPLWDDHTLWPDSQSPLEHGGMEDNSIQIHHSDDLAEEPTVEHIAPEKAQPTQDDYLQSDREENSMPFSLSSPRAGRGLKSLRSRLNRRQSVHSPASSGYQELIFDSGSSRPSSPASSGRRGPLDSAARAAMKAVKAVRACWRCKFLRKTCSPEDPCLRCPVATKKHQEKSWRAVGCNRGTFKEVLPPLYLCPRQDPKYIIFIASLSDMAENLNKLYHTQRTTRSEVIRNALETSTQSEPTPLVSYLRTLDSKMGGDIFKVLQSSSLVTVPSSIRPLFTPLEECITDVVYEAIHCARSGHYQQGDLQDLVVLLYSAAKYQAKIDSDELIAQSIICLRSCFEAVRMTADITGNAHRLCETGACQMHFIRNLNEHIDLYLDELSKVFFKKENMRVKETWWLSAFYSFAIHGQIRKLLQQLSSEKSTDQYLHLTVRLFIVTSGDYDPLTRGYVALAKGKEVDSSCISNYQEAKNAVHQDSWGSRGILSSADYLRDLFEDRGQDIIVNRTITPAREPQESTPEAISSPGIESSHGSIQKETPSTTWLQYYPVPPGSRVYRPSSLSSMESSSDIASTRASPAPSPFLGSTPITNPYFPGSSFGAVTQPSLQNPPSISLNIGEARIADEKQTHIASASARFRQRRREKEQLQSEAIKKEERRIAELEETLKELEAEKEYYRHESDRFREVLLGDMKRVTETSVNDICTPPDELK